MRDTPPGRKASGEIGLNNAGLVRLQGIVRFAEALENERTKWRKAGAAPVQPDLQGKGPVRQRSLSAKTTFDYFVSTDKVIAPAAIAAGHLIKQ